MGTKDEFGIQLQQSQQKFTNPETISLLPSINLLLVFGGLPLGAIVWPHKSNDGEESVWSND